MASDDPGFESKAADIIGPSMDPPLHAAVFCLDGLDPVQPLSAGQAERHGFDYCGHGTLSLYAALNTGNGEVFRKTVARHTSDELVGILQQIL